jgi:lactoylglutathione lyase
MKLNHLNLTVSNVLAAQNFLEKYFDMHLQQGSTKNFAVLFDDNGLVLSIMKAGHNTEVKYPGNFHIGFIQTSESQVDELNRRMKNDGFAVQPPEHHHAYTFYVDAPGGFTVEVLA